MGFAARIAAEAGLGLLAVAGCHRLLAAGLDVAEAGALLATLGAALALRRPAFGLGTALGAAAAAALLPAAGARVLLAAGAALSLAALRLPAPAWRLATYEAGLGGALAVVCLRSIALLLGHPVYAAALCAAAAGLGAWAGRRFAQKAFTGAELPLLAAGLLAAGLPHFLRFLGINHSAAELIESPILHGSGALFLGVQSCAALAAAAAALFAGPARDRRPSAALLAGPAIGWGLLWLAGPGAAAAALGAGLVAIALWRWPRADWKDPLRGRLLGASALAALALWAFAGDPFGDAWQARLNAAYPGGGFVAQARSPGADARVYQFSTGLRLWLADGRTDYSGRPEDRFVVVTALLTRFARRALIVGDGRAGAIETALSMNASISAAGLSADELDATLALSSKPPAAAPLGRRALRAVASAPPGSFGLVLVFVGPARPETAFLATREAIGLYARALERQGLLGIRLGRGSDAAARARLFSALRERFPNAWAFPLPSGSWLAFASENPAATPAELLERLQFQDEQITEGLRGLKLESAPDRPVERPETLDWTPSGYPRPWF